MLDKYKLLLKYDQMIPKCIMTLARDTRVPDKNIRQWLDKREQILRMILCGKGTALR